MSAFFKITTIFLASIFVTQAHAQVNIITTIAGTYGPTGSAGDNGPAIYATLYGPEMLCLDKYNNIYFTDRFNHKIRKITASTGIITTIAGSGYPAYSGDGGPATSATLNFPEAVIADTAGNIYIGDRENFVVRKVTASTGIITTIAGTGVMGDSGEGGLAVNAQVSRITGLCLDRLGNLYLADWTNAKIKRIDGATGIITTFAGAGSASYYSGENGPATAAFITPTSVYADSLNDIYLTDEYNNGIRKINAVTGIITTVAGTGTIGFSGDNGPATDAEFYDPRSLYIDKQQNIFISDQNGAIRKINALTGIITTVAGTGISGYSGNNGPATNAQIASTGIFLDDSGSMYIGETSNEIIRKVTTCTTSPVASFTHSGSYALSFTYTGTTANFSHILWSFGDGDTSTLPNPTHSYAVSGNYTVCVKVFTGCGVDSICHSINALCSPPVAAYTDTGMQTKGFIYTGGTTGLDSVRWSFGDGGTSTALTPVHTYATAADSYYVCLALYNSCSADTLCGWVHTCTAPTASFTDTGTHSVGFTYTGSTTGIDSVHWSFGDGDTASIMSPLHTYTANGTYHACVYVYTTCGIDSACHDVVVSTVGVPSVEAIPSPSIWPNPIKNELHIDDASGSTATFYDIVGRKMYEGKLSKGKEIIYTDQLEKGVYILQLTSQDGTYRMQQKIVKQ